MLQVLRAFDQEPVAAVPMDDAESIERKLDRAYCQFRDRDSWLKPHQRIDILRRVADLMRRDSAKLTALIVQESGKPLRDARIEVVRAIDGVLNATEEIRHAGGREVPMGATAASEQRWAFTTLEPIGVAVAFSAFNHPLNLIVHQAIPAIAVGCPVLIKPAPATPLSCLTLVELFAEAGLEESWCQTVITDQNLLAELLAADKRVVFLSFIGSARVGWTLRGKVAPGARISLEHVGVAPAIVDRRAILPDAIELLTKGGYYHAGQVCVSTQRIFVHANIFDEFSEGFSARVRALKVGVPANEATEIGPLIRPKEVDRVQDWVAEARGQGAILRTGGERLSATTLQPIVLQDPPANARVSFEEVFGPVTCLYKYDQLDEAIAIANSLPFAFQACVFSQDLEPALRAVERLDASTVMVNDHTAFRTDWMPFGGHKMSGLGVGGHTPFDAGHDSKKDDGLAAP
jgi:acyl-CoA reductase-like NAD-dependent aldehyde dehydrogenase